MSRRRAVPSGPASRTSDTPELWATSTPLACSEPGSSALRPVWSGRFTSTLSVATYHAIFNSGGSDGLRNSVVLGIGCALVGMAVAVLLSWRISFGGAWGRVLDLTSKLPGALSHVVVAVALVAALAGPPQFVARRVLSSCGRRIASSLCLGVPSSWNRRSGTGSNRGFHDG